MNRQEKFNQFVSRWPHDHTLFWRRPPEAGLPTRRQFVQLLGAGLSGYCLWPTPGSAQTPPVTTANVTMQNKARNCIFLLLGGGPSHIDTFDFKMVEGVTPDGL